MRRNSLIVVLLLILCLLMSGCQKKAGLEGSYTAVNPPVESGEMVIESLQFQSGKVTMISGSTSQTVDYTLRDGKFTIKTRFGDFTYSFEERQDGSLLIDGVLYQKN